jgi:ATP-dependent exoDNAse (exonuclease V) beta subunit
LRFDHSPYIDLPRAKQINTPSGRRYQTPDGNVYPSITTVLGDQPEKKRAIAEWRNRVGAEEANKVSQQAARRGTDLHNLMETYILGDEIDTKKIMPSTLARFRPVQKCLDENLQLVYASETPMYSDLLRIAGTADLICEWNGEVTVIDFKTARKMKTADMITDYFVQATAYSIMFEEHTGIECHHFAILMVSDEGEFEVFSGKRNDYVADLIRIRNGYEYRKSLDNQRQTA